MPGPKQLEKEILRLLSRREPGQTICPSEVARAIAPADDRDAWEPLLQPVRAAAQRLVTAGQIVITQKGRIIDAASAKGPIRLRLR